MAAASETRIQLCGRLLVRLEGRRIEDELPGRQGRLLFVFLAANRTRAVSRAELAAAIWPDEAPAAVEAGLAPLLSKVRRVVGPERIEGRSTLRATLPAGTWVDLEAAGEALHRAEGAIAREDWTGAWGPGRTAQHIAVRGFLPGEEAPWIGAVRRDLAAMYLRSLEITARAGLAIGRSELDTAERSSRSLIEQAPFRESGYRYLMEVLAAQGNTAEALHVYERLRVLLREELGAAPDAATQKLHRRLLA